MSCCFSLKINNLQKIYHVVSCLLNFIIAVFEVSNICFHSCLLIAHCTECTMYVLHKVGLMSQGDLLWHRLPYQIYYCFSPPACIVVVSSSREESNVDNCHFVLCGVSRQTSKTKRSQISHVIGWVQTGMK